MLKIGLPLLILPPLALMAGYLVEHASVQACIDNGGAWNYRLAECGDAASYPFIPYMVRHPLFVNGGMLLAVLGLIFCLFGLYRGRR